MLNRLPLYTEFYRPEGTVDQLLGVVKLNGRQGNVLMFNRAGLGALIHRGQITT